MAAIDDRKIGARVRRLRRDRGLSQREVADPLMTPSYLSLIEAGHRHPSPRALGHIATRLGVDVDEIVTGRPSDLVPRLELDLQRARASAHRGEVDSAQDDLRRVFDAASKYDMFRLMARSLTVLGSLAERRGDYGEARSIFDEAQRLFAGDPPHLKFEAAVGYARCCGFMGEARLGVHLLETYLLELERQGLEDPTAKMRVHSSLVRLYRDLGLNRQAVAVADQAVRLSASVEDPEQIACMSMNVAQALMEDGRHDDAIAALRRAEQIYQSLDWPLPVTWSRLNRGIVESGKGQLEAARETFRGALAVLESLPSETAGAVDVLGELGRVERLLGNVDAARAALTRALELVPESAGFERGFTRREMGLCLAASDTAAAERELRGSADDFRAADCPAEAATSLLELGRLLLRRGNAEAAARVFEEGLEFSTSTASG